MIQKGFELPFVRQLYGYDHDAVSASIGLSCDLSEDMTVQSEKDDADINVIVERFGLTGQLPQNVRVPLDSDFIEATDFQSAMNAIVAARESFESMPANVRSRFGNDPAQFVAFCQDKDNLAEMRKLGLAVEEVKEAPVEPMLVRVVPEEVPPVAPPPKAA